MAPGPVNILKYLFRLAGRAIRLPVARRWKPAGRSPVFLQQFFKTKRERGRNSAFGRSPQRQYHRWEEWLIRSCQPSRLFRWGIIALVCVVVATVASQVRINHTGSLPYVVYRTKAGRTTSGHPSGLERGETVMFCLPDPAARLALRRGYAKRAKHFSHCTPPHTPYGKHVLALPGDTVLVTPAALMVNGEAVPHSATAQLDSNYRPLPSVLGTRDSAMVVVPLEHYWLHAGHHPRSFDSRYYGPVPRELIQMRITPLFGRKL